MPAIQFDFIEMAGCQTVVYAGCSRQSEENSGSDYRIELWTTLNDEVGQ